MVVVMLLLRSGVSGSDVRAKGGTPRKVKTILIVDTGINRSKEKGSEYKT
jgi:hypothetical protein